VRLNDHPRTARRYTCSRSARSRQRRRRSNRPEKQQTPPMAPGRVIGGVCPSENRAKLTDLKTHVLWRKKRCSLGLGGRRRHKKDGASGIEARRPAASLATSGRPEQGRRLP